MMGVFDEFERAMTRERVKSGLERAKAQGKVLGRPLIDAEKQGATRGRGHRLRERLKPLAAQRNAARPRSASQYPFRRAIGAVQGAGPGDSSPNVDGLLRSRPYLREVSLGDAVMRCPVGAGREGDEEFPMQDLMENYVSDLKKLRDMCHDELTATAEELIKAMGTYAQRSDAALASFMEKASARGSELEASAAARLNQFCGLPANNVLPNVDDGQVTHSPTNVDVVRRAAAAERAVAQPGHSSTRSKQGRSDGLHVDSDGDRKPIDASLLRLPGGRIENYPLRTSDGAHA
jgi:hypothetical protein